MNDFSLATVHQPESPAMARRLAPVRTALRAPRSLLLTLATVGALLLCVGHGTVAGANTPRAAAWGYLCFSLTCFLCAIALFGRARSAHGTLHIRWMLIAAASLSAAIGYAPSFTEIVLNTGPARALQTGFFNVSEALYMLAIVLFSAGVSRSIVLIDTLQALLFVLLRFHLIYSPTTSDHFTVNHLVVGQLVALFLFLVSLVACLGAASHDEFRFLRVLSWFFGLRLIGYFLSDQVCYTWLHQIHCGLWDVPGTVLLAGFALCLLYTQGATQADLPSALQLRSPGLLVRSLMPSFLAFVNLMLGLFLLSSSTQLAAVTITVSLACYVVRTTLLQAQAATENARLETRNQHLEGLAVLDPLTGIGNRRSLAAAYSRLQSEAGGERLALLLIDIDHFKQANDSHGHLHGDQVLIALARKLESLTARGEDSHCARLGGDEFALLLPNASLHDAFTLAEKLRTSISSHIFEPENSRASLSIGVTSLRAAGDLPIETLISCADEALYRAKLLGRNRVEVRAANEPGNPLPNATQSLTLDLQRSAG